MKMETEDRSYPLHIICERDVGLFSLIQQVISHIPWALKENRIPVVYFGDKCCYWNPEGYMGKNTVWEYYFEPVISDYPASSIPLNIINKILWCFPNDKEAGYFVDDIHFVSNNYGDHHKLKGKTLPIPFKWADANKYTREKANLIIKKYIKPRKYIVQKIDEFYSKNLDGNYIVGVHIRGTDSISKEEKRIYRKGSLNLKRYKLEIDKIIKKVNHAVIFVATDDENSLNFMKEIYGDRIINYHSIRHTGGDAAAKGPMGKIMPAFLVKRREIAASSGEEAVIEYFLLTRTNILIHNGASLARVVLLTSPDLDHINTHRTNILKNTALVSHVFLKKKYNRTLKMLKRTNKIINKKISKTYKRLKSRTKKYWKESKKDIQNKLSNFLEKNYMENKIDAKLIKKVETKKEEIAKLGVRYKDQPKVSLIILSFNHRMNVKPIMENLRKAEAEEVIICEDGSIDGSLDEWVKYLEYPNDFLIRSNDLHEIRAYDRAINLSRGEYICILQDDDIPPDDGEWITNALKLFELYPKLAILGGYTGRIFGERGERYRYKNIPFVEPKERIPFMFVQGVNVGPIFYQREIYKQLGGYDYKFSKPGEPGIHFDYDICLRAWINGWTVGLYSPGNFDRRVGVQGTKVFGSKERSENKIKNMRIMKNNYWKDLDSIEKTVQELNSALLKKNKDLKST